LLSLGFLCFLAVVLCVGIMVVINRCIFIKCSVFFIEFVLYLRGFKHKVNKKNRTFNKNTSINNYHDPNTQHHRKKTQKAQTQQELEELELDNN
jgi:hypothetical protein